MCRRNGLFFSLIFILFSFCCWADGDRDTLDLRAYLGIVMENHPLIKKANVYEDIAEAHRLKGRGTLDPKRLSSYNSKYFDGTNYFRLWQTEVKIPTSLPIDFSVGYERNDGSYLNGENTVPKNGLVYGTLNVSLLRGFLFDEQRYAIQLAEVKGVKSQIEKELLVREVIYQAIRTYIEWSKAENELTIYDDYRKLVSQRHNNVKDLLESGDIPAIDTLESRMNLNTAEQKYLDAKNKRIKAIQELSLFIWNESNQPMQLNERVSPVTIKKLIRVLRDISSSESIIAANDPSIRKYDNAIKQLSIANRLQKEHLKPQLDVKYNTITSLGKDDFDPSFSIRDYQYGLTFQLPLRNRKTRGEIRLNESIIKQKGQEREQYLGQMKRKIEALTMQKEVQSQAINLSIERVGFSQQLQEAEQLKFSLGESSIFLVNKREQKLLQSNIELLKSYTELGYIFNDLYFYTLGQR